MSKLRHSFLFSIAEDYATLLIQITTTVILARLLTPTEIGIFSVTIVLISLAHRFRDFGVTEYLIQEKNLTREKIQGALAVNISTAWIMSVIIYLSADWAASFYNNSGVKDILILLAFNFLILPISSNIIALLKRDMNFKAIFIINIAGATVHAVTAVYLALLSFSFMSLAWAAVASTITTILFASFYRPKLMPYLPSFKNSKNIVSFGGIVSVSSIISTTGQGMPDMALGKNQDFEAVGLFSRANSLVRLFNQLIMSALNSISLPDLSQRLRNGESIKEHYLMMCTLVTGLAWPFFISVAFMAYPAIYILYGDQWLQSVGAAQLLSIGAIAMLFAPLWTRVLLAYGLAKDYLKMQIKIQFITISFIITGSFFSLNAVATAIMVSQLLSSAFIIYRLSLLLQFTTSEYFRSITKSIAVTITTSIPLFVISFFYEYNNNNYISLFVISSILAAAFWGLGILLFRHPLKVEFSKMLKIIKK